MNTFRKLSLALVPAANVFPAPVIASTTSVSHSKSYCGTAQFKSTWTRKNDGKPYQYFSGTFYEKCKGIVTKGCYMGRIKNEEHANPLKDKRKNVSFLAPADVFRGAGYDDKESREEHKQNKWYAKKVGGC